jgi:ABC-type branched-subunit amino acid transport system substrate-binding protein
MVRHTGALRLTALAACTVLAVAACGGSSNKSSNTPKPSGGTHSSSPSPSSSLPKGDGHLVIGEFLPQSGDLAFLGPPEFAGIDVAVKEINAAGGVLGHPVTTAKADSGDLTPNIGPASVDKLLNAKADAIIGAASSSVSLSVIDKIINAGDVMFSPANTSTEFDTYPDKGLYFRTAPSDVLQGAVMGNLVVQNGGQNVAILSRQDSYGTALNKQVTKTITAQGAKVAANIQYNPDAQQFTAEVNKIAAAKPDAIVVIAFQEVEKIIPTMISAGIGPKKQQIYFVDGDTADYSKVFPKGTLTGVEATYPGAELHSDFRKRMLADNPKLTSFTYGPSSYDATIMTALAADAAKNDSGKAIASQLINISEGGTPCTTYAACKRLLDAGKDIDYNGVSGPVDLNPTGSPIKATIGIFKYAANNTFHNIRYVAGVAK